LFRKKKFDSIIIQITQINLCDSRATYIIYQYTRVLEK